MPLLFYDDLKLKSFEGEFIRQALKERALFGIGRRLTHKSKVSGVRAEPLNRRLRSFIVLAQVLNSSSTQTVTLLSGMTDDSTRKQYIGSPNC